MRTLREAWRTLTGRAFWRDFRAYYSPAAIAGRLDRLAERLRKYTNHEEWKP